MSSHIKIQWVGHRKDGSKKGSVWGWFTETGKAEEPSRRYYSGGQREEDPPCYVFWGRIGKIMYIEQRFITTEFLAEATAKTRNFRSQEPDKIMGRWGKVFDEELSMYILTLKLKG
jgi:hypothetical protein